MVGTAAAWLWMNVGAPARSGGERTSVPRDAALDLPQASDRATVRGDEEPSRSPASPEAAVAADAAPASGAAAFAPNAWDARFRESDNHFEFARAAAEPAVAGDARAQYWLAQALRECDAQMQMLSSMRRPSTADNIAAYMERASKAPPRVQERIAREIRRCEALFHENPLDGFALPTEARWPKYWAERALESRDALAAMDRAAEESLHQHSDSMPPEHRAELLADVRTAVESRDPAALYKIGAVYSQSSIAADDVQGAIWTLAACESGFDCSNANPTVGQGCVEAGVCEASLTLPALYERDFGSRFAEISAAARDVVAKIDRGDWEGLQPYLATR